MKTAIATARALPRPLLAALCAVLSAALAVISVVRWWNGEPAFLRVFLCACYGWGALFSAAAAVALRRDGRWRSAMKVIVTTDPRGTTAVAADEPVTVLQAIRSPKPGGKPS